MAFRFRLESVLRLRRSQEEQAKLRLAVRLRALAAAQAVEAALRARAGDASDIHEQRLRSGRLGLEDFLRQGLFQSRISAEIGDAGREIEARRADVINRRSELAHAARERETLERLRDKHRVRFRREQDRKDARLADELYLAGYGRRTSADPAMAGSEQESSL